MSWSCVSELISKAVWVPFFAMVGSGEAIVFSTRVADGSQWAEGLPEGSEAWKQAPPPTSVGLFDTTGLSAKNPMAKVSIPSLYPGARQVNGKFSYIMVRDSRQLVLRQQVNSRQCNSDLSRTR